MRSTPFPVIGGKAKKLISLRFSLGIPHFRLLTCRCKLEAVLPICWAAIEKSERRFIRRQTESSSVKSPRRRNSAPRNEVIGKCRDKNYLAYCLPSRRPPGRYLEQSVGPGRPSTLLRGPMEFARDGPRDRRGSPCSTWLPRWRGWSRTPTTPNRSMESWARTVTRPQRPAHDEAQLVPRPAWLSSCETERWGKLERDYLAVEDFFDRLQLVCRPMTVNPVQLPLSLLIDERLEDWQSWLAANSRSLEVIAPTCRRSAIITPARLARGSTLSSNGVVTSGEGEGPLPPVGGR